MCMRFGKEDLPIGSQDDCDAKNPKPLWPDGFHWKVPSDYVLYTDLKKADEKSAE